MNLRLIKDKIRNLVIIMIFLCGLPYLSFLFHRARKIALVRVLCWHNIPDRGQFKKKILLLIHRYHVVSIKDLILNRNLVVNRMNLVLTFDDGYKNWMDNVLPVLKRYSLPATFFISSGELSSMKGTSARLSVYDIRALIKHPGFTIASHGRFHKDLAKLDEKELETEILEDKKYLEKLTGREIKYLALPFGLKKNFNKKVFKYYDHVFSMIPGFNLGRGNQRLFYRDSIDPHFSNLLYRAWLSGAYDWYWGSKRQMEKDI